MNEEEAEAVHDDDTTFYVLYVETIRLAHPDPQPLNACIHWYIGDADYSSVPFTIPANAQWYDLKNCGFVLVPDAALKEDSEKNSLTLSITSWEGEHLGVFFGHCGDIATSETFDKHDVELLHEDGSFATAELHAARQGRWTLSGAKQKECVFVDPSNDAQAKHIWEFIAPEPTASWKGTAKAKGTAPPAAAGGVDAGETTSASKADTSKMVEEGQNAGASGSTDEKNKAEAGGAASSSRGPRDADPSPEIKASKESEQKGAPGDDTAAAEDGADDPGNADPKGASTAKRKSARKRTSAKADASDEPSVPGKEVVVVASASKEGTSSATTSPGKKTKLNVGSSNKQAELTSLPPGEQRNSSASSPERKMKTNVFKRAAQSVIDANIATSSSTSRKSTNKSPRKSKSNRDSNTTGGENKGNKVGEFLLDKGVEQLNEFTNKVYASEGCRATLMHPSNGQKMPVRMRILMKKTGLPVPGSEVSNIAEDAYLEIAKDSVDNSSNPFLQPALPSTGVVSSTAASAALPSGRSLNKNILRSVKLSGIKNLFLGANLSPLTKRALKLTEEKQLQYLHPLCVTMQISEELEFLTLEFLYPDQVQDVTEDGLNLHTEELLGNKSEYLPQFIELCRSYYAPPRYPDEPQTYNLLSKQQFPDVKKVCEEAVVKVAQKKVNDLQTLRNSVNLNVFVGEKKSEDEIGAVLAGGKEDFLISSEEKVRSDREEGGDQRGRGRKTTTNNTSIRKTRTSTSGGRKSVAPSPRAGSYRSSRRVDSSAELQELLFADQRSAAKQDLKFLQQLKKSLPSCSASALPEAARQFFNLKVKLFLNNVDGADELSSAVVDTWCHEFWSSTDIVFTEKQLQLGEHLSSDPEHLRLPWSLPDHAKLVLKYILADLNSADTVPADLYDQYPMNSLQSGLHILDSRTGATNLSGVGTSTSAASARRRSNSAGSTGNYEDPEVVVLQRRRNSGSAKRRTSAAPGTSKLRVALPRNDSPPGGSTTMSRQSNANVGNTGAAPSRSKTSTIASNVAESSPPVIGSSIRGRGVDGAAAPYPVPAFSTPRAAANKLVGNLQAELRSSSQARRGGGGSPSSRTGTPGTAQQLFQNPAAAASSASRTGAGNTFTPQNRQKLFSGAVDQQQNLRPGSTNTRKEIATYQVLRNGISVLVQPVYGDDVQFTGQKLNQNAMIVVDQYLVLDNLKYLRLIDRTGWVVDDSMVNPATPSLKRINTGAVIAGGEGSTTLPPTNLSQKNYLAPRGDSGNATSTSGPQQLAQPVVGGATTTKIGGGKLSPGSGAQQLLNTPSLTAPGLSSNPSLKFQPSASAASSNGVQQGQQPQQSAVASMNAMKQQGIFGNNKNQQGTTSLLTNKFGFQQGITQGANVAQDRPHDYYHADVDHDIPSLSRPLLGGGAGGAVAGENNPAASSREESKNSAKYLISPGLNGRPHPILHGDMPMGQRDMPIGADFL
ncbi:unnamed protein product [Amoebophrya sp. A120]|nr:unnamed protein product [Amoebophrya sp. A120]|eukprot:GSA120T00000217001.1